MTIKLKIPTKHTLLLHNLMEVMVSFAWFSTEAFTEKPASGHAQPLHVTCLAAASHVESL